MYKIDGCFANFECNICLIHIYKNASISFRNIFDMRGKYYKYNSPEIQNRKMITVTIIRHPINRIVSIYLYMLRDEDFGFPEQHSPEKIKNMAFYKEQNLTKSFKLFIEELKKDFFSAVTLPQTTFLQHRNIDVNDLDFIFIQENMEKDFARFIKKFNLPNREIPFDNEGNTQDKGYLLKLIADVEKINQDIRDIYLHDFELYDNCKRINLHNK